MFGQNRSQSLTDYRSEIKVPAFDPILKQKRSISSNRSAPCPKIVAFPCHFVTKNSPNVNQEE